MYSKKPHWFNRQWGFCVRLWGDVGKCGKDLNMCQNGGIVC